MNFDLINHLTRFRQRNASKRFCRRLNSKIPTTQLATMIEIDHHAQWSVGSHSQIVIDHGSLQLGALWPGMFPMPSQIKLADHCTLEIIGNHHIYSGFLITVNEHATLTLGDGYTNYRATIECFKRIVIGHHTVIGPDVHIRDSDNHAVHSSDRPASEAIEIGKHCWIGARATILKGVTLGDGVIVAAGAVVTHSFPANTLIGGIPARELKSNVVWS